MFFFVRFPALFELIHVIDIMIKNQDQESSFAHERLIDISVSQPASQTASQLSSWLYIYIIGIGFKSPSKGRRHRPVKPTNQSTNRPINHNEKNFPHPRYLSHQHRYYPTYHHTTYHIRTSAVRTCREGTPRLERG